MKQQMFNKAQQEKVELIMNHPWAKLSDYHHCFKMRVGIHQNNT